MRSPRNNHPLTGILTDPAQSTSYSHANALMSLSLLSSTPRLPSRWRALSQQDTGVYDAALYYARDMQARRELASSGGARE